MPSISTSVPSWKWAARLLLPMLMLYVFLQVIPDWVPVAVLVVKLPVLKLRFSLSRTKGRLSPLSCRASLVASFSSGPPRTSEILTIASLTDCLAPLTVGPNCTTLVPSFRYLLQGNLLRQVSV